MASGTRVKDSQGKLTSLSSSTWSRRFCSFVFTPLLRLSTSPVHPDAVVGTHAVIPASQQST